MAKRLSQFGISSSASDFYIAGIQNGENKRLNLGQYIASVLSGIGSTPPTPTPTSSATNFLVVGEQDGVSKILNLGELLTTLFSNYDPLDIQATDALNATDFLILGDQGGENKRLDLGAYLTSLFDAYTPPTQDPVSGSYTYLTELISNGIGSKEIIYDIPDGIKYIDFTFEVSILNQGGTVVSYLTVLPNSDSSYANCVTALFQASSTTVTGNAGWSGTNGYDVWRITQGANNSAQHKNGQGRIYVANEGKQRWMSVESTSRGTTTTDMYRLHRQTWKNTSDDMTHLKFYIPNGFETSIKLWGIKC